MMTPHLLYSKCPKPTASATLGSFPETQTPVSTPPGPLNQILHYNYISKYGENLYDLVDGGQITASDAKVQQGCIEGSNVNVVDEMVKMITISRAYQAGQKVINTVDETLDKTVNQVGKV